MTLNLKFIRNFIKNNCTNYCVHTSNALTLRVFDKLIDGHTETHDQFYYLDPVAGGKVMSCVVQLLV